MDRDDLDYSIEMLRYFLVCVGGDVIDRIYIYSIGNAKMHSTTWCCYIYDLVMVNWEWKFIEVCMQTPSLERSNADIYIMHSYFIVQMGGYGSIFYALEIGLVVCNN